jgi:NitT/TauT family transport system substrate-binding protein
MARRLGRAMNRSLGWIHTHSLEEIAAQTPEELRGTDPSLFKEALRASLPSFPLDARFESAAIEAVVKVLKVASPGGKLDGLDLKKTYTNEFVTEK